MKAKKKPPQLVYQADPIRESLKVLGAKWTLIILRDVALLKLHRFGELRRNNPGLTSRVLSRRLHQMVAEGLLERNERPGAVTYYLTAKGEDAIYVLLALLRYGVRHHMKRGESYAVQDAIKELDYHSPPERGP